MGSITKLSTGRWRAQVRRKGVSTGRTFKRIGEAEEWVVETEARIDAGEGPPPKPKLKCETVADLVDIHIRDMCEVGKAPRRSKEAVLDALKAKLGHLKVTALTRERLIQFGRERAKAGAGPVTVAQDFTYLKMVASHAAAVHGVEVPVEAIELARLALKRLDLIGKSRQRDRRPTAKEVDELLAYFDGLPRQAIPMGRIIQFAISSAMRQEEITRIRWADLDEETRTVIVRDRKDPREKTGNHQKVPLLAATGFDAWALVRAQRPAVGRSDRIFPYNGRSIGTAFRRACRELKIAELRFHDLRHEGASRLFEAGFAIEQVALVTGHRDWKMLKRYTHLKPEDLHRKGASRPETPGAAQPSAPAQPAMTMIGQPVSFRISARLR